VPEARRLPGGRAPSISAIFPAFNEVGNLKRVVGSALEVLPRLASSYEVIIVDDGSQDGTGALAKMLVSRTSEVRAIHHPRNRGYGAALKSGIEEAKNDLIFFCDSDGQFDLEDLEKLLVWIDAYDMVIGYRERRQDPFYRRMNARGWKLLVRLFFGLRVRDIDCAFKVFRREIFDRIRINTVGAMVNTEILVRAVRYGFTMKEVPVRHYPRRFGTQTGAKPRVILKAFLELIRMYRSPID
jgi:glycosyltransferase involved in cell wall biosynthesis